MKGAIQKIPQQSFVKSLGDNAECLGGAWYGSLEGSEWVIKKMIKGVQLKGM